MGYPHSCTSVPYIYILICLFIYLFIFIFILIFISIYIYIYLHIWSYMYIHNMYRDMRIYGIVLAGDRWKVPKTMASKASSRALELASSVAWWRGSLESRSLGIGVSPLGLSSPLRFIVPFKRLKGVPRYPHSWLFSWNIYKLGWWLGVALFQEAHISWMKNPKTGQSWGFLLILDVDDEEWLGAFWIIEWSRHVRILYCVVLDCRKFVRRTLDYF